MFEARRERRLRRRLYNAIARDLPHPRLALVEPEDLRIHSLQMSIDHHGAISVVIELRYPRKEPDPESIVYTTQEYIRANPHILTGEAPEE